MTEATPMVNNTPRVLLFALCLALLTGCNTRVNTFHGDRAVDYRQAALEIEYPDANLDRSDDLAVVHPPRVFENPSEHPEAFRDLTLDDCVREALKNSRVIRDLGGRVVSSPTALTTVFDPAVIESNPRVGVEAALSAFDAKFNTSMFWAKGDRPLNRFFPGIFRTTLEQDLGTFTSELSKATATGGTAFMRYNVNYEWNNNPTNLFPSAWYNALETEFRQPLLQGAGVEFNRIAGPNAQPGFFFSNGVLIARINTDISLADFEAGVRNFVSDVENAYWDLYFAYRDLDAKIEGQNSALKLWQDFKALVDIGAERKGSDSIIGEAQARQQYFQFRALVQNALSGRGGGSTIGGGANNQFRGAGGLYARESNLRFLMGLPPSGERVIRPVDEPSNAAIEFDWDQVVTEALHRRVELRRQRWQIRRRELELTASRNFLMPRLDAVGLYRWQGLGDNFINPNGPGGFNNAVQNLTEGNYQEWQLGLQMNVPIGFRQQLAAVRNAELQLARERAVLREQELQVTHDLSAAIREVERAYKVTQTRLNGVIASMRELQVLTDRTDAGTVRPSDRLDAVRKVAEARSEFFRSLVDYNLAIKNVHFEKGTLLEYDGIYLNESPSTAEAHHDAQRNADRLALRSIDYRFSCPERLSLGVYDQHPGPIEVNNVPADQPPLPPELNEPNAPTPAPPPPPQAATEPQPGPLATALRLKVDDARRATEVNFESSTFSGRIVEPDE